MESLLRRPRKIVERKKREMVEEESDPRKEVLLAYQARATPRVFFRLLLMSTAVAHSWLSSRSCVAAPHPVLLRAPPEPHCVCAPAQDMCLRMRMPCQAHLSVDHYEAEKAAGIQRESLR